MALLTSRKLKSSLIFCAGYRCQQCFERGGQRFILAQQALQGSQFSEHDIHSIFKHVLFQR